MTVEKHSKQELIVYALLWGVLFLAPVLGLYIRTAQSADATFQWSEVLFVWQRMALFFVMFLLHSFFLAPLLVERQRRWLYFSLTAVLLALFIVVQCGQRPEDMGRPGMDMPDMARPEKVGQAGHRHHADEGMVPPADEGMVPPAGEGVIPPPHREHVRKDMRPPLILGEHDAVAVIILILMLGMNLGVKLYFRQLKDRERMAKLKKQSLEQQLEYLRYQISPHFLMNTLNNIHALVDIDSEQAKDSIVSLSQIMRFALYEGSKQTVPLSSELAFTRQYIQLMRMRVSQRVRIDIDLPSTVPDAQIPPLMLITFVENAFKHGVSYRQESFIEVSATVVDGTLSFRCRNSKAPKEKESPGGVGLSNVKRRLELIYGKNYSLDIKDLTETYNIELTLPL